MHSAGSCRWEPRGQWPGSTCLTQRSAGGSAQSGGLQATARPNVLHRRAELCRRRNLLTHM